MQAGRELDALVAEKVFGWKGCRLGTGGVQQNFQDWYGHDPSRPERSYWYVPHFSTEIDPAMRVAEKMRDDRGMSMEQRIDGGWAVQCPSWYRNSEWTVHAELPAAICLAALKAVGVEVPA
jgi:hypothetical protein